MTRHLIKKRQGTQGYHRLGLPLPLPYSQHTKKKIPNLGSSAHMHAASKGFIGCVCHFVLLYGCGFSNDYNCRCICSFGLRMIQKLKQLHTHNVIVKDLHNYCGRTALLFVFKEMSAMASAMA